MYDTYIKLGVAAAAAVTNLWIGKSGVHPSLYIANFTCTSFIDW